MKVSTIGNNDGFMHELKMLVLYQKRKVTFSITQEVNNVVENKMIKKKLCRKKKFRSPYYS